MWQLSLSFILRAWSIHYISSISNVFNLPVTCRSTSPNWRLEQTHHNGNSWRVAQLCIVADTAMPLRCQLFTRWKLSSISCVDVAEHYSTCLNRSPRSAFDDDSRWMGNDVSGETVAADRVNIAYTIRQQRANTIAAWRNFFLPAAAAAAATINAWPTNNSQPAPRSFRVPLAQTPV